MAKTKQKPAISLCLVTCLSCLALNFSVTEKVALALDKMPGKGKSIGRAVQNKGNSARPPASSTVKHPSSGTAKSPRGGPIKPIANNRGYRIDTKQDTYKSDRMILSPSIKIDTGLKSDSLMKTILGIPIKSGNSDEKKENSPQSPSWLKAPPNLPDWLKSSSESKPWHSAISFPLPHSHASELSTLNQKRGTPIEKIVGTTSNGETIYITGKLVENGGKSKYVYKAPGLAGLDDSQLVNIRVYFANGDIIGDYISRIGPLRNFSQGLTSIEAYSSYYLAKAAKDLKSNYFGLADITIDGSESFINNARKTLTYGEYSPLYYTLVNKRNIDRMVENSRANANLSPQIYGNSDGLRAWANPSTRTVNFPSDIFPSHPGHPESEPINFYNFSVGAHEGWHNRPGNKITGLKDAAHDEVAARFIQYWYLTDVEKATGKDLTLLKNAAAYPALQRYWELQQ